MNIYEAYNEKVRALGEHLMGKRDEFQRAAEEYVGLRMVHFAGSPDLKTLRAPCRDSYGWCFVHMAKALPPEPIQSIGALSATTRLEVDLHDVHPDVLRVLTDAPTIDAEPVGIMEDGGDD